MKCKPICQENAAGAVEQCYKLGLIISAYLRHSDLQRRKLLTLQIEIS